MKIIALEKPVPDPESDSDPDLPPQNPCECAEERKPRRIRARDCLSAASSSGTPLEPTQAPGSPFLCLLSFGEAKESRSPAAATERHRNSSKYALLDQTRGFDTLAYPVLRYRRVSPNGWGTRLRQGSARTEPNQPIRARPPFSAQVRVHRICITRSIASMASASAAKSTKPHA